MTIIRQESLFDIQVLINLEPTHDFIGLIFIRFSIVMKKSRYDTPQRLTYCAPMIYSFVVRITELILTIKNLIRRLNIDLRFKVNCSFLVSDEIP